MSTNGSTAANAGSAGPTSSASAAAATPTPTPIVVDLVSTAFAAAAADAAAAAPTPIAVITPPLPSRNASSPSSSHPRGREGPLSGGLAATFMPSPAALAPAPSWSSSHRHSSSIAPSSERRGDYHQLAGPTGAWVVPPNRKRKAEDLFGDDDDNNNKAAILKTWPGRAAADIFLPPSAGAAGGAFFANPAAIRAVAAARRHVADRFPNPRPVATRNDKNGGNKRRCVAQATLHHHLRPLQSCFADVDEVARGGALGVAKALAGLPGGDMGVDRPRPPVLNLLAQ
ncbi:hypothetical protein UCDDS831_g03032 [Diplodia seriata]|uniref:Uncharacterized protein n=1 Tax=Diplodia seriata TaxID=420778 RepID=A0A0G2EMB2_9PEZI|nr:hypothetical protein UCDDS831_g03032 [Diplodia seriata]